MRRQVWVLVPLLVAGLFSACGQRERTEESKLLAALDNTEGAPYAFKYEDKTPSGLNVVTGEIQDDLAAHATFSKDGAEVLEEYIADDAIAIRLVNFALLEESTQDSVGQLLSSSRKTVDNLLGGQFVHDPSGAPPVIVPRDADGTILVGQNHLLDSIYATQYIRRAISEALSVALFNEDSADYFPREDPFRDRKPNKDQGVIRYDLVPPPLPRRSAQGTTQALAGVAHFRKMVFFVRQGKVFEVLESIDFESHRDFRQARLGRGPKYPLQILAAVRAGQTREPIRVRRMSFELTRIGSKDIKVELPPAALTAPLRGVFGPQAAPDRQAPPEEAPPEESGATQTATDAPPPPA